MPARYNDFLVEVIFIFTQPKTLRFTCVRNTVVKRKQIPNVFGVVKFRRSEYQYDSCVSSGEELGRRRAD